MPTPIISLIAAGIAAYLIWRRFHRRRGFFCWSCNHNLRGARLHRGPDGELRCPRCGELVSDQPPGYMKIRGYSGPPPIPGSATGILLPSIGPSAAGLFGVISLLQMAERRRGDGGV